MKETRAIKEPPPAAEPGSEPEEAQLPFSFGRTLLQFFIIPAFVVAVCVAVFLFFGWMVSEEKTGSDYLREVKTGSASRRWQAAFELAKWLNSRPAEARAEGVVLEMIQAFDAARRDDPRVRRYLAVALGNLKDNRAAPALLEALSDGDAETRIYAIWGLGSIGDRGAVGPLMKMVESEDPGIRKMAVYSLGALRAEEARELLQSALEDSKLDVAWNAAIALAQLGDGSGRGRILQMLDRSFLDSITEMTDGQRAEAMITGMQGAVLVRDPELRERLVFISRSDPNLNVRQAAFEALAETDNPR